MGKPLTNAFRPRVRRGSRRRACRRPNWIQHFLTIAGVTMRSKGVQFAPDPVGPARRGCEKLRPGACLRGNVDVHLCAVCQAVCRAMCAMPPLLAVNRRGGSREPCSTNDLGRAAIYRRAYGEAARLIESARFDHCFGRDFAAGIGGNVEAIRAEVHRRMGREANPEAVEMAVTDAMAGRSPRW